MRLHTRPYSCAIALTCLGMPLRAQSADALYAGRPCNQELEKLRAVTITDVVDSSRLTRALREAADSASPITKVVLSYDAYGQLSKIKTAGTRSSAAAADLEREVRAATKPVPGMPDDFMMTIVRLNRRDVIDMSPFPLTCPPSESSTSEATGIMRTSRRFRSPPPRDALVQLWLGSNGDDNGRVDHPERWSAGVGQPSPEGCARSAIHAARIREHTRCYAAAGPGAFLRTSVPPNQRLKLPGADRGYTPPWAIVAPSRMSRALPNNWCLRIRRKIPGPTPARIQAHARGAASFRGPVGGGAGRILTS